jgi:hypothetical protein
LAGFGLGKAKSFAGRGTSVARLAIFKVRESDGYLRQGIAWRKEAQNQRIPLSAGRCGA